MPRQTRIILREVAASGSTTAFSARSPRFGTPGCTSFGGFRRGGAVLETVLVISLLISLSLGAAEYGYALFLKHSLMAATTVGVRTAILSNSTDTAVQTAVASQMAMNGLQRIPYTLVTVPISVNNCTAGTYVTVTVSCTWGSTGINTLPVSMGGFAANKTFSTSATMVHE